MIKRILTFTLICLAFFQVCSYAVAESDWHVGRMSNGIDLHIQQSCSQYVTVAFRYHVGAVNDPVGKEGLAHLFEHIAFHGSKRVSRKEVDDTVALHAGRCEASASWFETTYIWELPASHWTFALDFELDRISGLSITEEQLEIEKRVIARELDESGSHGNANSLSFLISECLQIERLRPVGGSKATVSAITVEDLIEFHSRYYRPKNLDVFVCGGVDPKTANIEITNRLADVTSRDDDVTEPLPVISAFKPMLALSSDDSGAFVFCESNSSDNTAWLAANALFNLTGSRIVRESLISRGLVSSLSLKTLRLPDLTVYAVLYTPKRGGSVREAWDEISQIGREFVASQSFKTALGATKNRAVAAHYRSLMTSYATIKDILIRRSLDAHLNAAKNIESTSTGGATKFAVKLFGGYTEIAVSSHSQDIDSDTEKLDRGKKDTQLSNAAVDGAKLCFKTSSGAMIRLREVGDADIAEFCIYFPRAASLNFETALLTSLVSFHSLRGSVPITYTLEQLGWYWDIGRENWAFWGLQRNLPNALDVILQLLDDFRFYDEEIGLQTRFRASSNSSVEAAKSRLIAQSVYAETIEIGKDIKEAANKVYGSRDFCVSADVQIVNSGIKMLFSRRFGALSEIAQQKVGFSSTLNSSRPGIVALTEELTDGLSFVGIAWNGCAVLSPDYPAFLAYASLLGAGNGLSGVIVERLRHEMGFSYNVQVSVEHIGNAAIFAAYAICAKEDRDKVYSELKGCIEQVSKGKTDDDLLRRAVVSASARLNRATATSWLFVNPSMISRIEVAQLCLKRLSEISISDLRDTSSRLLP